MKSRPLTEEQVKDAADRAEGLKPDHPQHAGGRPPKYKDGFAKQASKLCALGATDEDLADFFEVSIRTIANWKARHDEFLQALKAGKSEADDRVERSLYQRAMGYSHDAVKIMQSDGQVIRAEYREHYPPDTTACIFWLKNRRPEQWRDKTEIQHNHTIDRMSDNDLERIAASSSEGTAQAPVDPSQLN